MANYELIEHTADIGIRVRAEDLAGLFKNAGLAMFDIIAQSATGSRQPAEKITINVEGDDLEELFVNWLNELLSLSSVKELIFSDFKIEELDKNKLVAVAKASGNKNYKINVEIKAATYHQLKLEQDASGWKAEVIFDV